MAIFHGYAEGKGHSLTISSSKMTSPSLRSDLRLPPHLFDLLLCHLFGLHPLLTELRGESGSDMV